MATTKQEKLQTENDELRVEVEALQKRISVLTEMIVEKEIEHRAAAKAATPAAPAPSALVTFDQSNGLLRAFSEMTLKQRVVTFATLDGASYKEIAQAMGVDETTVKLHLKAALAKLGAPSRDALRSDALRIVKQLEAANPEALFGAGVNWMTTRPASLMQQLVPVRRTTPPAGGSAATPRRGRVRGH